MVSGLQVHRGMEATIREPRMHHSLQLVVTAIDTRLYHNGRKSAPSATGIMPAQ